MTAYSSLNSRIKSTAGHHEPDIRARHCAPPEFLCFADSGPEQRPLAVALDAGSLYVRIEKFFQLVMAGHFIDLAVFLAQAEPPAFLLREVILDAERDDGPDAGEGVRHYCDCCPVAHAYDR